MIYATFIFWFMLIIFAGLGVYRLWSGMIKSAWVNWALLPGTVISEMAYIFGCLITGGEIRRAKLIPERDGKGGAEAGEPRAEATAGMKFVGPMLAAVFAIVACGAAILGANALLGEPVTRLFRNGPMGLMGLAELPRELPASWGAFWDQVNRQVWLLRRMSETWVLLDWTLWKVPVFVYLSICLAIRLSPVSRSTRATLAAGVTIAVVVAVVGMMWRRLDGLMDNIWPLLTFVWSLLLFLLVLTLLIRGALGLIGVLFARPSATLK